MVQKNIGSKTNFEKTHTRVDPLGNRFGNLRVDSPHLLLPAPHFDVRNAKSVDGFLDNVDNAIRDGESAETIGLLLRKTFGVLRLAKNELNPQEWQMLVQRCRAHQLCQTFHEDPFTRRSFDKPRGYAGDAELLDFIYDSEMGRNPQAISEVGKRIHRWTINSHACNGVKERRSFIAETIDRLANQKDDLEVLSIACGHFREAEISSAILRKRFKRIVALDTDSESLEQVKKSYGYLGIETVLANASEMIRGNLELGQFDFVYSAGLFDYLTDSICRRLASKWFGMLKPGGVVMLTNFLNDIEEVGYMETFMDWNLIYRNRLDMMAMTSSISEFELDNIKVFSENNRSVICLLAEKKR